MQFTLPISIEACAGFGMWHSFTSTTRPPEKVKRKGKKRNENSLFFHLRYALSTPHSPSPESCFAFAKGLFRGQAFPLWIIPDTDQNAGYDGIFIFWPPCLVCVSVCRAPALKVNMFVRAEFPFRYVSPIFASARAISIWVTGELTLEYFPSCVFFGFPNTRNLRPLP